MAKPRIDTLTDSQEQLLHNALILAIEAYADHAATFRKSADSDAAQTESGKGARASFVRLAEQFERQAQDASALLEWFRGEDIGDDIEAVTISRKVEA